ncbi:MAG: LTA synthase family protein [Clostridiales bacterium]|nr:LTA synthase family protein [Clostridiales bacterium]
MIGSLSGKRRRLRLFIFFPASVLFMELVLRIYCFDVLLDRYILYVTLFSSAAGLIAAVLGSVWTPGVNRLVSLVLLLLLTVVFCLQAVYFTIFDTFFTLFSVTGAGAALGEFWPVALDGIRRSAVPLLLLLLPFIVLCVFSKRPTPAGRPGAKALIGAVIASIALQLGGIALIRSSDNGIMSDASVYTGPFSPDLTVPRFGVLTTLRLDIGSLLDKDVAGPADPEPSEVGTYGPSGGGGPDTQEPTGMPVYGDNVLEIDFDTLIAEEGDKELLAMHRYFSSQKPTPKNEYTGMFEGYNLIWIVAEAFSSLALDETHTPTLSKLAGEGFVFENFYNPVWGVSTSDGEYVATTGLIPKAGVWSYYRSAGNSMPFGFGNMLGALGYVSHAYHNNTYTYYNRDKSYPNMGYVYKAVGNGLEITKQWPQSDVEMVAASLPDFIGAEHFLTYYMTVSGHMNYTFMGNMMAYKHKSQVADLPYSEPARAYIACQMEFDASVRLLIEELDKAGKLDNTVIVISGDHYPYGLEHSQMEEISGSPIEKNFELYRSALIIWNPEMKAVHVGKYCSSLDIMPTLANLFALPYDSRLVMGRDILADTKPLVIFSNRSFITDLGRYNARKNAFIKNEGAVIPEHYARDMAAAVNNKFKYSAAVLDRDYYGVVFGP